MLLDHERLRLAALKQYDVLDTPPEECFDRITAMAARLFDVGMSCITLVDQTRYFFKSAFGADITELDRQPGFCDAAIQGEGVYCVEDTSSEPTVESHPMVCNPPYVRFYAGSPLKTGEGFVIGTLCLLDSKPRIFPATDRLLLQELSEFVMFQLDRRRIEAELKRREEDRRNVQKLESLGLLASGIAHDFNNLLVGILGNASLAQQEMAEGSDAHLNVENIVRAASQAKELTDQLLAYAGQRPLIPRSIDLLKLLDDMSPLIRSSISKAITLEVECESDVPAAIGDSTQIRQVALNLITNASEAYGNRPGVVSVRVSSKRIAQSDPERARLGDLKPGRYAILEVTDHGCGMDDETLQSLFDPFYTTKTSGRGLGMSIVQRIVRGHGGVLQVESKVGEGCTVTVYLPAGGPGLADDTELSPVTRNLWAGAGTVLVVDDEDVVADVTSSAVKYLGFDVISAADGAQALQHLDAGADDIKVVILDASLAGTRGAATLDEVKKQRPELPTVITSGHHVDEVAHRFQSYDKLTFLQKPWTVDTLAGALREALAK